MADDLVKDALDGVVKAIGFGIVSDYREMMDSLVGMSNDLRVNTGLIDQVNRNVSETNRSLDSFQAELYRQRERRRFKQTEDKLEGRIRLNSDRSEQSLRRIAKALEDLQRQMNMGAPVNNDEQQEDQGGGLLDDALDVGAGAAAGSFLAGAASVAAIGATALGGALVAGAVGAYLMGSNDSSESTASAPAGSLTPTSSPSGTTSTPTVASDTLRMGTALSSSATTAPIVNNTIKTSTAKAIAKVGPRVPSYLSKNGGRIESAMGARSVQIFGALIGGYFSFSRFMSGDSWTTIGAAYVDGVPPTMGNGEGAAGWAADVATTLAIQTYLITRDIYQEENFIDIKNGVVPNFDDLPMQERSQLVKAVGAYVTTYVNSLISRSADRDATTGVAPTSTSGAAAPLATMTPAAATQTGASTQTSTGGDAESEGGGLVAPSAAAQSAPDLSQEGSSGGGGGNLPPAYQNIPQTGGAQQQYSQQNYMSPAAYPGGKVPDLNEATSGVSPGNNIASMSTQTNQGGSMYEGGDYGPILDYIADSEGADYDTQYGYQNTTGGRRLSEMTVAEVMQAQQKQTGSSAIGRYQFMRQTMIDGLNRGIITPDETFSPATQDRLATWLIDSKRKGASWRAGKMKNEDFGRALSQEWASVPNPYTGKSYHGQGIKYGTDTLMNVLSTAKGPAQPMAEGAKVTPLTADKPKAGRDMTIALRPLEMTASTYGDDEDKITSSSNAIDARKKEVSNGSPKEKMKNSISYYMPVMSYAFGHLSDQFMKYAKGEVTADAAFKDAMNPLS